MDNNLNLNEEYPMITDTFEDLGINESDLIKGPTPIPPSRVRQISPTDTLRLSPRSFDIVGKGKTVYEWQEIHRKHFPWWIYASTGIFCRAGEQIKIRVHGNRGIDAFIGTRLMPYNFTPQPRWLTPGLNTISDSKAGLLYFSVEHTGTISVEVVSGGVASPRFILGVHTLNDFSTMVNTMPESGLIELESERTYIAAKRQNVNNGDPITLLKTFDESVVLGDQISGLSPNNPLERDKPDPHKLAFIETTGFFAAGLAFYYGTGYNSQTMANMLMANLYKSKDHAWAAWHEHGHMRQQPAWMWHNLTEMTVDIYSMYISRAFGNESKLEARNEYARAQDFRNKQNPNFDEEQNAATKLVMFWQLALAFGDNFYPRLHKLYRALPLNEVPKANSGEIGKQAFIYMASLAANRNLRPFFEKWGITLSQATIVQISKLPPLVSQIWNGRDNAKIIEYIIPDNAPLPNPLPESTPPLQTLNGNQGTIITSLNQNSVIDASGTNTVIQTANGSSNQLFEFTLVGGNDIYIIKSVGKNQYLAESGQNIILASSQASATRWRIIPNIQLLVGIVSYELQSTSSNLMIDLAGSSTTNGTKVGTWTKNNGANQSFLIKLTNEVIPLPPPITQPAGLLANSINADSVSLNWSAVSGAIRYDVYRNTSPTDLSIVGSSAAPNYTDLKVKPQTTYYYHVTAINQSNQISAPSGTLQVTTPIIEQPMLTPPTGLLTSSVAHDRVALTWMPVSGATRFDVYRGTSLTNLSIIGSSALGNYLDTTIKPQSTYYYNVTAVNSLNQASNPSETITVNTPSIEPPISLGVLATPTNLEITNQTANSITIRWNSPQDTSSIMKYEVFRNGIKVSEVPVTAPHVYVDSGLLPNTNYSYTVRSAGVSENSNKATATTPGQTPAPTLQPPTNIRENGKTANSINIAWAHPSSATGIQGYIIYRNNSPVGNVPLSQTNYNDTGLIANTTYSYRVASFGPPSQEATSGSINITTNSAQPPSTGLFFYQIAGEGGSQQMLSVRNASGNNVSSGFKLKIDYTGGGAPNIQWPADFTTGLNGNINAIVREALTTGKTLSIPIGQTNSNTRITNVFVNDIQATKE